MAKTYNSLSNVTVGSVLTASDYNEAVENSNNFRVPPMCVLTSNTTKTATNNAWVTVDYQVEDFDTDAMHSTVSNIGRITPTTAGLYVFQGMVSTTANSVTGTAVRFLKNGATIVAEQDTNSSSFLKFSSLSCLAQMDGSTDYIEFQILYVSTGNGTMEAGARLSAAWLGQVS
jgi:hypothetical protein